MIPQPTQPITIKHRHFLAELLGLTLAAAVLAGIFYWQTSSLPQSELFLPVHKSQNSTANWKTYTNSYFEFKYPTTYQISSQNFTTEHRIINGVDVYGKGGVSMNEKSNIISIDRVPTEKDSNILFQNALDYFNRAKSSSTDTFVHLQVDGIDAVRAYIGAGPSGEDGQSVIVTIPTPGYGYRFDFTGSNLVDVDKFDQILSTFKFTSTVDNCLTRGECMLEETPTSQTHD